MVTASVNAFYMNRLEIRAWVGRVEASEGAGGKAYIVDEFLSGCQGDERLPTSYQVLPRHLRLLSSKKVEESC